jgi:hypothetical protein
MATPHIFPKEHLAFVRQLYLRYMLMPAEITDKVNLKYKTDYAVTQISRVINTRGWSKRRKAIVEKLGPIEKTKDTAIIREIAQAHAKVMDDVAKGTTEGLSRAVEFVRRADNPRSMQAAASGLKSLLSTFMLASGLENSGNARAGTNVFQVNFSNVHLRREEKVAEPVEPTFEGAMQAIEEADDDLEDASTDHD